MGVRERRPEGEAEPDRGGLPPAGDGSATSGAATAELDAWLEAAGVALAALDPRGGPPDAAARRLLERLGDALAAVTVAVEGWPARALEARLLALAGRIDRRGVELSLIALLSGAASRGSAAAGVAALRRGLEALLAVHRAGAPPRQARTTVATGAGSGDVGSTGAGSTGAVLGAGSTGAGAGGTTSPGGGSTGVRAGPAGPGARSGASAPVRGRPRAAPRRAAARGDLDALCVDDAGMVLLWPFIPHFFGHLGLLDGRAFRDPEARLRGVALLRAAVGGDGEVAEFQLPLARVLCGVAQGAPFDLDAPLTDDERDEAARMLEAVVERATILKRMSVDGLRGTFLLRPGLLGERDGAWLLRVERRAFDVVLDRFPWSWSWVKLPWMREPLQVEW